MNQTQRVIKYIAIAFGLFLAVNIICGIVFGFLGIVGVSFMGDKLFSSSNVTYIDKTYEITDNISSIRIDLSISELDIRTGSSFKVETANVTNSFELTTINGVLRIKDNEVRNRIFNFMDKASKIIVYIPENIELDKVEIKTGIGITNIEYLQTKNLRLELGVGNFVAQKIISKEITKIQGGVGRVQIYNGEFKNLDLSAGVGEFNINAVLTGSSNIECGIGKIKLELQDSIDNYRINTETGIGSITINGNSARNNASYGTGGNLIRLNGGIGSVEVRSK